MTGNEDILIRNACSEHVVCVCVKRDMYEDGYIFVFREKGSAVSGWEQFDVVVCGLHTTC